MALDNKTFILQASMLSVFTNLSDTDAGILVKCIFAYVNNHPVELQDKTLKTLFDKIKRQIDSEHTRLDKKEDTARFWKLIVDTWFNFYTSKFDAKPTFSPSAARSLKSIMKYIEEKSTEKGTPWNEDIAIKALSKFLSNAWSDLWLQDHFLLPNLLSKFDSIINKREVSPGYKSSVVSNREGYKLARLDTVETVRRLEQNIKDRGIPGEY